MKKKEEKKEKQKDQQRKLDELENLIKQLEQNTNATKVKIIQIKEPTPKDKVLNILIDLGINILLYLGITGWYHWIDNSIYEILGLAIIYTLIENLLKNTIRIFFPKLFMISFGLIDSFIVVLSYILSLVCIPSIKPSSTEDIILFFLIFIVIKSFIKIIFLNKSAKIRFIKRK